MCIGFLKASGKGYYQMSDFRSCFADKLNEYVKFRCALGFSNDHHRHLLKFDQYCVQFHPTTRSLTADLVKGLNIAGYIPDTATVLYSKCLHSRCYGQAESISRPVWVSNYQIGFHWIQTPGYAFDSGIIAFLIDHKILRLHPNPSPDSF